MMPNRLTWTWMLSLALVSRISAATDAECSEILRRAIEAHNPETRTLAVVALSLATDRDPMQARLEEMLQDKDVGVRLAVVASLAELKTKGALAALHQAMNDDVPEVSFAAAKALWSLRDPAGKQALMAVLQGESKTSSNFFSKQKRDALRMMHTPRTTFLYALRQGVGFAPVPGLGAGIASMQQILTDPGISGRATAALLLGNDRDPATIEGLKDALYDKDSKVRAAAVHSLCLQNDPAFKKDLEPLLEDDKEEVRLRAAAGYLRLSAIEARRRTQKRAPAPEKK
ncbi:PBS lyase HEAT domain protein repeat-containing protein [Candidatus Sulfopaludibacter sp. SbA6]|nr:PBS lyase HEAT domain protein repeat-containing protein [Candidatus Sulfopaludibacter sp. SbA6]